jgi:peptidoglycan/LPS O-acetylase OafA/YrhL
MNKKSYERILELDSLRGIASLLVVLFHLLMLNNSGVTFNIGSTGVDLFFMISGFVIYNSLAGDVKASSFLKTRFIRLYPIYWAILTFTFVLIRLGNFGETSFFQIRSFRDYFINLTMFQHYFNVTDLDGPFWTLIIELNFYILILFMLPIKQKIPSLFFVLSLVVLIAELFVGGDSEAYKSFVLYFTLFKWVPLFASGILFYKIYKKELDTKIGVIKITICYLIQIFIFYKFHLNSKVEFISFTQHLFSTTIYFSLFILLVLGKLNFVVNKATLFLGKISYSLYLVHQFISISILIPFFNKYLGINYYFSSLVLSLTIVLFISFIFNKYIEIQFSYYLRKKMI